MRRRPARSLVSPRQRLLRPGMLVALLGLSTCHRPKPNPEPVSTASPGANTEPRPSSAANAEAAAPQPLGYDPIPSEPSGVAHVRNAEGLEALRKGRNVEAIARFDEAVKLAPAWPIFRFNRVCARAKNADYAAAARELEQLLRLDPVNFRPRWFSDPDLATLRASAFAMTLTEKAQTAFGEWERLRKDGFPVQITGERTNTSGDGEKSYRWVQAGVYLAATQRFLATTPRLTAGPSDPYAPPLVGSLTDSNGQVVLLTGIGNNADIPSIRSLELALYAPGTAEPRWKWKGNFESPQLIEVAFIDGQVHARPYDCNATCGFKAWLAVSASGAAPSPKRDNGEPRLLVNQNGVYASGGALPGLKLKPEPPTRRPPRVYQRLAANSERGVSVDWYGDIFASGMSDAPNLHRVRLFVPGQRELLTLSEGPGWTSATFDAQGALYLCNAGEIRRFPDPSVQSSQPLPKGLSF